MRKTITVEKEQLSCDGCQYLMSADDPCIEVSVPFDYELEFLRSDPPGTLSFQFHATQQRHDCYRYWAHDPHVMKRSLKDRGLDEDQIDDFMSLMIYKRENGWGGPGVARPKEKASV